MKALFFAEDCGSDDDDGDGNDADGNDVDVDVDVNGVAENGICIAEAFWQLLMSSL